MWKNGKQMRWALQLSQLIILREFVGGRTERMKQGRNQHISYLEDMEKAELGNILDNYTWPLLVVSIILIGKKVEYGNKDQLGKIVRWYIKHNINNHIKYDDWDPATKRQRMSHWIKKQHPTICCLLKKTFHI